jgi:DNA repair protein RecO
MNLCQFQLYKSAYRYTIVQCQCLQNFKKIREDFDRSMMAGLMMEIFHKSTLSSEHSAELFDLLRQSLHKLNDSPQHFLTIEGFKLNLLKSIGVLPDMESCASCHERWNIDHSIWLENSGHLHCQECSSSHAAANPKNQGINATYHPKAIDFNIIKLISYLTQPIDRQTKTISFNSRQKEQLRHITHFFLQHFIEREIMSERLLPDI